MAYGAYRVFIRPAYAYSSSSSPQNSLEQQRSDKRAFQLMGQTARKNNKKLDGRRDMSPTYQLGAGRQGRTTWQSHQWHFGGSGLAGCDQTIFPQRIADARHFA
jgi:hypothetical protein